MRSSAAISLDPAADLLGLRHRAAPASAAGRPDCRRRRDADRARYCWKTKATSRVGRRDRGDVAAADARPSRRRASRGRRPGAASWSCRHRSGRAARRTRRRRRRATGPPTAVALPKRLVTPMSWTSAMAAPPREARSAAPGRSPCRTSTAARGGRSRPTGSPSLTLPVGGQPGLDLPVRGVDRHDLGRAEILGAEHLAAQAAIRSSKRTCSGRTPSTSSARRHASRNGGIDDLGAVERQPVCAPVERALEGQEVHRRRADEVGDEHAGRPVVDLAAAGRTARPRRCS